MGDGNLTPAPWILCCVMRVRSIVWNGHKALEKLSGRCLRRLLAKASSLQDHTVGSSARSELGASPYSKRTGCPFLEEQLGMLYMPLYSLHPGWTILLRAHRSYGLTISGNPGICRSQISKTRWACEASSYIGIFYHANATLQLVLGRPLPTH